jgi:MFS transporter, SHS family, lactate transporter
VSDFPPPPALGGFSNCPIRHRGGAVAGSVSQYIGRRLTIMCVFFNLNTFPPYPILFLSIFVCLIGLFIPLWIIPDTFSKLSAGAFWVQFGVQG